MGSMKPLAKSITTVLRGAGGGGGSPRTPIESPDSLRSIAYARILDLISEGEIYGLSDQANPLSCVFLNETAVANDDGSLNFKNIQIDTRVGTQTQDYIKGFPSVESEVAVGVQLRQDTPWTHAISDLNLSAINVRLSVPNMTKTNTTNGDITGSSVSYQIELSVDGGPFNPKLVSAFTGKTTTKYERGHRIDLPPATTGWAVRVRRTTPDSESSALVNATYVEAYTDIIDAKLRYPMCALASVVVDAEQFSNIPRRAYRMKGRILRVPSNYDPDTRTYTGAWDGTFQSRYSNNPAWVFYDMAINTRYGLGRYVTPDLIDKWNLYRIAQYCDGMVDDGFGGEEPRFTCNLYFQQQADALKVMQDLSTVFRGIMYAAGGAITAVGDMPEDSVYTYTQANVIDGKFTYSGSARKVRHTMALVSWNDMNDFGRAKVAYVPDDEGIARYGIQETQVIAIGCTSPGQAYRLGKYLLATERLETQSIVFGVGLEGTIAAPGKIIDVADPLRAGRRFGGRMTDATINSVTVDELPVVEVGDTITAMLPSGVSQKRTVLSVVGNKINVTINFTEVPVVESSWIVESSELVAQKFRVLGVSENDDGSGYTINAIQHVEGKYAFVEDGIIIDSPPISTLPGSTVPSPQNLTCVQREIRDQNTVSKAATLNWDPVVIATSYNVQWRQGEGSWVDLGNNASTNREIHSILPGPFEVQVVAINALGIRSLPTFGGPYDIGPVTQPPIFVDEINNNVIDLTDDIAQEVIDRAAGDLAEASARADAINAEAAARADALLNERLYTDAAIENEQTLRQNADESLAEAISTIVAGTGEQFDSKKVWYFDTALEGWTGSADGSPTVADGFVRPANGSDPYIESPHGIAVNGDSYKYVKIRMHKTGTPVWLGRVSGYNASGTLVGTVDVDEPTFSGAGDATVDFLNIPWSGTVDYIRVKLTTAQSSTDAVKMDWIAIGRPAPGASTAALQEEQQARVTADAAEATARITLASQMRGNYTGTDVSSPSLTSGLVFSERQARTTADSALASDITSLQGRVTDTENDIDATATAVDALEVRVTTAEGVIDSHSSSLTSLNSRVTTAEGSIAANSNAINTLDTRVTTAEGTLTANSSAITSLTASVNDIGDPKPNLVANPTGAKGTTGWLQSGAVGFEAVFGQVSGNFFRQTANTTTVTTSYTYDVPAVGSQAYTLSMEMANTGGNTSPSFSFDMLFYDVSNALLGTSSAATYTASTNYVRKSVSMTSPAGTTTVRIRVNAIGHPTNVTRIAWRRVKLEGNATRTPYNDEGSNNATATAQTLLEARVTTAEGVNTTQSAAITILNSTVAGKADVSAMTALTTRVAEGETSGQGQNLLTNSSFAVDLLPGYDTPIWNSGGGAVNVYRQVGTGDGGVPDTANAMIVVTSGPSDNTYNGVTLYGPPALNVNILPNKYYIFSVFASGNDSGVWMAFFDAAGNNISDNYSTYFTLTGGGKRLGDHTRIYLKVQAPANATRVRVGFNHKSVSNAYLFTRYIYPMLEEVPSQQATPSGYGAGGLEMSATYTLKLDVNNYVTGWNFNNNGTSGNFTIVADNFAIVKPGGGARTEYSNGNWRVYDGAGTLRVRFGVW